MSPSTEPRKIQLQKIAHVRYIHKDVEKAHEFLLNFGLSVVEKTEKRTYYRGYGSEPFLYVLEQGPEDVFDGAAFAVESLEELQLAVQHVPGASQIYDIEGPGGGKCVTFHDPVDKFPFHLVYGQAQVEYADTFPELSYNFPTSKHRPVNKTQRFRKGPAPIHKLGHFGLCVTNYAAAYKFYTSHFNFKPTELVHNEIGNDVTTFMHLDRGEEWVDHHCFFFFEGPKFHVHHSSFEVHDFDIQLLGHDWLREKGYESCWGVGRHVMGSQIFDYWFDPSRFILEHYVDGDLVNDSTPINRTKGAPDNLHVWGPDLPPTFLV